AGVTFDMPTIPLHLPSARAKAEPPCNLRQPNVKSRAPRLLLLKAAEVRLSQIGTMQAPRPLGLSGRRGLALRHRNHDPRRQPPTTPVPPGCQGGTRRGPATPGRSLVLRTTGSAFT